MNSNEKKPKARYIMVGGFLGAGKTTAIARLAEQLRQQGLEVGLITNDQGRHLVDTAMLSARGFAVEEIAGGCFCCRFQSLTEAAERLSAANRPDVFIAEPVGSCTDLVATVSYPLRRIYGEAYAVAPLSVVLDPVRAQRVLGMSEGGGFSDKVAYIYRKQLEEANLILVNKCDLLTKDELSALKQRLMTEYPQAELLTVSARSGAGMGSWLERVMIAELPLHPAMEVDYALYGEGEALLGWLNATLDFRDASEWDGNTALRELADWLRESLGAVSAEVAHLKMTLEPEPSLGDLAVLNLVRNDYIPELSQELEEPVQRGRVVVNLRAEAPPETLEKALTTMMQSWETAKPNRIARVKDLECFRPGQPVPVHRLSGTDVALGEEE